MLYKLELEKKIGDDGRGYVWIFLGICCMNVFWCVFFCCYLFMFVKCGMLGVFIGKVDVYLIVLV